MLASPRPACARLGLRCGCVVPSRFTRTPGPTDFRGERVAPSPVVVGGKYVLRLALTDAGPLGGAILSESAFFCPVRCVVLLCRRNDEPLRPIRELKADVSAVFADPGMPDRGAVKAEPFALAAAPFEDPPGAGKGEMPGSSEAMLV